MIFTDATSLPGSASESQIATSESRLLTVRSGLRKANMLPGRSLVPCESLLIEPRINRSGATFGGNSITPVTNLGTTAFPDVTFLAGSAPTGFTEATDTATGLESVTFTSLLGWRSFCEQRWWDDLRALLPPGSFERMEPRANSWPKPQPVTKDDGEIPF